MKAKKCGRKKMKIGERLIAGPPACLLTEEWQWLKDHAESIGISVAALQRKIIRLAIKNRKNGKAWV